jgi:hypothetical protein
MYVCGLIPAVVDKPSTINKDTGHSVEEERARVDAL